MGTIVTARAYANNEIAFVAWSVDGKIPGCVGFELTRIYPDDGNAEVPLAAWVPFTDQKNPNWVPQTTSVWPVQRLMWRDLTVRKRRDDPTRRNGDVRIKYRIRALVPTAAGLTPVTTLPPKNYEGDPFPLAYVDNGVETNDVNVTMKHGPVRAAFTNGILSGQWLGHALAQGGEALTKDVIKKHIANANDSIRKYLSGDVVGLLREFLDRQENPSEVKLALYELTDLELKNAIEGRPNSVRLILSNTGQDKATGVWDTENKPFRDDLAPILGNRKIDRMYNNNERIGHNKFAVYANAAPREVLTGSTNWTPTGLCSQTNNAMIVESGELAKSYSDYWDRLAEDTKLFTVPNPPGAGTKNVQGPKLREEDAKSVEVDLADGTHITFWASPNTKKTLKDNNVAPPDLADLFSRMRDAKDAILFAAFLPSMQGSNSIIAEAVGIGKDNSSILVYGSVSDPMAMPNYVPPEQGAPAGDKTPQPATYDVKNVHVVRASALGVDDVVGDFEKELLTVGQAIIHDKIVVVDPLSKDGFVAMGSHNLGYKASYQNDENLLIIKNNSTLVQAYAVHVLDVYDHYRFRAAQADAAQSGKSLFNGFLARDDGWMSDWLADKGDLSRYLAR